MLVTFPTGLAQYTSLIVGVAAISVGLSSLLPVRWGWKASPLVGMGLSAIAALLLAASVAFADAIFKGHGGSLVISPRAAMVVVAVAGVAFGLTLSARRRTG
jgi:hypothetical protein